MYVANLMILIHVSIIILVNKLNKLLKYPYLNIKVVFQTMSIKEKPRFYLCSSLSDLSVLPYTSYFVYFC